MGQSIVLIFSLLLIIQYSLEKTSGRLINELSNHGIRGTTGKIRPRNLMNQDEDETDEEDISSAGDKPENPDKEDVSQNNDVPQTNDKLGDAGPENGEDQISDKKVQGEPKNLSENSTNSNKTVESTANPGTTNITSTTTDISSSTTDVSTTDVSNTTTDASTTDVSNTTTEASTTTETTTGSSTTSKPITLDESLSVVWSKNFIKFNNEIPIVCRLYLDSEKDDTFENIKKETQFKKDVSLSIDNYNNIDSINYVCMSESTKDLYHNTISAIKSTEMKYTGIIERPYYIIGIKSSQAIEGSCYRCVHDLGCSITNIISQGSEITKTNDAYTSKIKFPVCTDLIFSCFAYNSSGYPYSMYRSSPVRDCDKDLNKSSGDTVQTIIIIVACCIGVIAIVLVFGFMKYGNFLPDDLTNDPEERNPMLPREDIQRSTQSLSNLKKKPHTKAEMPSIREQKRNVSDDNIFSEVGIESKVSISQNQTVNLLPLNDDGETNEWDGWNEDI